MPDYTANMSLDEQIGQVFMVGFNGHTPTPEILALIGHQHVGGIIFFSRNMHDSRQALQLTQHLQKHARAAGHRYPLLIAIDQENGMVQRLGAGATHFPGNMTLGAVGSEEIAREIAAATGRELKALGINMNLAPDVDVNNNPANPVIGVRSFGEDAQQVARLGAATVRGLRDAGVFSTLKHFPGHGDSAVDSHRALPIIPHDLARLEALELIPFQSAIEAGADSVMIAHIYFPALLAGEGLPATVSCAVIQGLLREKLGFTGMIITDCLEMDAISAGIGVEQGSVLALQAGASMLLVSHRYDRQLGSIEAVQALARSDESFATVVRQAAEHVLTMKARTLSWDALPTGEVSEVVGSHKHHALSSHAYELSTTLVRNEDGLIPLHLDPNTRLLVLTQEKERFASTQDRAFPGAFLVESIQKHHAATTALAIPAVPGIMQRQEIARAALEADCIILATLNANLVEQEAEMARTLIGLGKPIIGLALLNPYDLLAFPQLRTYMVTYEYTIPAIAAAVRVLFGEITPRGHLPVSLPLPQTGQCV